MQLEKKKTMSISTKGVMLLDRMVCSVVLRVLQGGFQELYHLDHRIAEEMNQWENNMIYGLECPQGGASLYLQWKDGTLKKVKNPSTTYRDAIIRFTSMHMAVLVLTGQIGISGAYALVYTKGRYCKNNVVCTLCRYFRKLFISKSNKRTNYDSRTEKGNI